ncbi:MAG: SAM-dependent methyltransferase [Prevotellaceae bacterium]|jgi:type I restriction-modification system DNA methylase subunit|nr:SAM-dependent methyltransferase [Prevotellaceae bacterium]
MKSFTTTFEAGLSKLGFNEGLNEDLFFTKDIDRHVSIHNLWFHLEKAKTLRADAIFCRKIIGDKYIPQVYLYDFTKKDTCEESVLAEIHKKIWTSSEVPVACVFTKTEVKILDTTSPIDRENDVPTYLDKIALTSIAHRIFNAQFANSIRTGTYWENEEVKKKLSFSKNSSYSILIDYLKVIIKEAVKNVGLEKKHLIQKLIVQSILVKYLEEKEDAYGNRVFPPDFFSSYANATCFCDILRNGCLFDFFDDLNKNHFNGKVFEWKADEKEKLEDKKFSYLADALRGGSSSDGQMSIWRLYSFNFIPVELISRLYEEFIEDEEKSENGAAYTPSHLANLLVDEIMPVENAKDLSRFKIIDPACGSGIFLVIAFKRLIQWWRIKNQYKNPSLSELKQILNSSIFGVDINETATQLTAFSLCIALCEELTTKQIWSELRFDDLTRKNIFQKDFFLWLDENKDKKESFDIVIGNPPFVRGGISAGLGTWAIGESESVDIPQNQIALKFLSESIPLLKPQARLCLIIKASGLLYNSTSSEYKKVLFERYNVNQILDFTPLARNKSLWDCGTDVAAAAIFLTKESPNTEKNILHAIFRRTKATAERIVFEIDEYDLHFISRSEAATNPYIFKCNLMGGGRIKNIISKLSKKSTFGKIKEDTGLLVEEGLEIGTNGKSKAAFLYQIKTLPTESFSKKGICYADLSAFPKNITPKKLSSELIFRHPNILIKENLGDELIPIEYNMSRDFTFQRNIIGIASVKKNKEQLDSIYRSLLRYNKLYRFYMLVTSGQVLVNLNTGFLLRDFLSLPLILNNDIHLSPIDNNVINDVNIYMDDFQRHGEAAKILKPVSGNSDLKRYGLEYSNVLNHLYADSEKTFKLSDIVRFNDDKFIGAVFTYDNAGVKEPKILKTDYSKEIEGLSQFKVSEHFSAARVIRYYSKNKVLFVKPNQMRYWLSSIAYRDADKTFADIHAFK